MLNVRAPAPYSHSIVRVTLIGASPIQEHLPYMDVRAPAPYSHSTVTVTLTWASPYIYIYMCVDYIEKLSSAHGAFRAHLSGSPLITHLNASHTGPPWITPIPGFGTHLNGLGHWICCAHFLKGRNMWAIDQGVWVINWVPYFVRG